MDCIYKPNELPGYKRRAILLLESERICNNDKKKSDLEKNRICFARQASRLREGPHRPGDYNENFEDDDETF